MKTIVGITGTTSVGKSAVAVQLAKHLGSEIVSADSMQIYRGMNIGTAKITPAEMQGVVHHMLDVAEPNEPYSAFLYQQQASQIIDGLHLPVIVGGTGFYFDSLLYPPEYGNASEGTRERLLETYRNEGLEALKSLLWSLDKDAYEQIDVNNVKRVIRAIEIAQSGNSRAKGTGKSRPRYNMILFVLERNREDLYRQIDARVDKMVQDGLVDEVKNLVDTYGICDTPAFCAIGYKEMIDHLQGNVTFEQAVAQIKINTRHYAKRQTTYFKKMNATHISVENKSIAQITELLLEELKDKNIV